MADQLYPTPFGWNERWMDAWKNNGASGYALTVAVIPSSGTGAPVMLWDGANWIPQAGVSLGNGQAAGQVSQATFGSGEDPGNGILRVGFKGGGWSVSSNPGSGLTASASQAAQGGTVRNVLRSFDFGICTGGTAPPLKNLTVNLRDGATGAGTILRSWTIVVPTSLAYDYSFGLSNLWIEGSQNTAMTLEFASGDPNTFTFTNLEGCLIAA